MALGDEELAGIVARASTLWERLGPAFLADDTGEDRSQTDRKVAARLARWREVVARGDEAEFQKRLSWDGLDQEQVRRILGPVRLAPKQPLPDWAQSLAEAVEAFLAASGDEQQLADEARRLLDPDEPLPFEECHLPLVGYARQRLLARRPAGWALLSTKAQAALERALLLRLANQAAQVLNLEFSVYRATHCSPFGRQWQQLAPSGARTLYEGFVAGLRDGALLPLLREYAVLARQLATAIDLWVAATTELLERLAADWPALDAAFGAPRPLGAVEHIKAGLSDPHNGGRSVVLLTFSSGQKVVYKPKNLQIEADYFALLSQLNAWGAAPSFRTPRVIARTTHGWAEFIPHTPCRTEEEACRYYQRAGMLLALIYVLGGTDCHYENLIACGEYPVVVDVETLMQHRMRLPAEVEQNRDAIAFATSAVEGSVLQTGLLPSWQLGPAGQRYDISGLGGLDEQETPFRTLRWENVNTDGMAECYRPARTRARENVPLLDGAALAAAAYLEELLDGFEHMYRFLAARRTALLSPDGPLAPLASQPVRFIARGTRVYYALLRQVRRPETMREGVDWGIEVELLTRALLAAAERPPLWPLLQAEYAALARLDVPFFTARPDGDALELGNGRTVEGWSEGPTFDQVLARLHQLGEDDLRQQTSIIRNAFYCREAAAMLTARVAASTDPGLASGADGNASAPRAGRIHTGTAAETRAGANESVAGIAPLSQEALVARAVAIAAGLRERAIHGPDGSATWLGLSYAPRAQVLQFQPLGYGVYDGNCGVALFLAALEKVTGGAGFRELALAALHVVETPLRDARIATVIAQTSGIGACGLGSLAYGLVRAAELLAEPSLLDRAERATALITPQRIAADQAYDVAGGSAGALLGLLALHTARPDAAVLRRAMACGQHLLDARVVSPGGARAWPTIDGKLLGGFAHGAAGIGYALLRLHQVGGAAVFGAAAAEAFAYERELFSPQAQGWRDLRVAQPTYPRGWCYGAAGIALSRLGGLAVIDDGAARQEIDIAVQAILENDLTGATDSLCCGILGRVDALLVAAATLGRPELRAAAAQLGAFLVARQEQTGAFLLAPGYPPEVELPGLYQGTAGVGYQLLRLACPEVLPSLLLWQ